MLLVKCNVTKYMLVITSIVIAITIVISMSCIAISNIYSNLLVSKAVDIRIESEAYAENVAINSLNKADDLASDIISKAYINPKELIKERDKKIAADILATAKFINSSSNDPKCQNAIYAVLDRNAKENNTSMTKVANLFATKDTISRGTTRSVTPVKQLPDEVFEAIALYYKGTDYSNGATVYYDMVNFNTVPTEDTVTAVIGSYIFKK